MSAVWIALAFVAGMWIENRRIRHAQRVIGRRDADRIQRRIDAEKLQRGKAT